ncbi:HEAT repeat-containing protein 4 [Hoplias malabaricus]|uniref:HEAT repeat-containing protein 4 n=1 Tax=Hoplias malabaricus TaxID=27720 RepID=UPI0034632660
MDLQQQLKGRMKQFHSHRGQQLYRQFLKNASEGLSFSQEVMWEMGADGFSYSKADFSWLFRASVPLAASTRSKDKKKAGIKKIPGITISKAQKKDRDMVELPSLVLPPLQTTRYNSLTDKGSFTIPSHQGEILDSFKRRELRRASDVYRCLMVDQEKQWDEFVLKKLTKTTAQWIVSQQIPKQCHNKAVLHSLLKGHYGSSIATDLITDEPMCEEDFCGFCDAPKPSTEPKMLQSNKSEAPLPVYYRVKGFAVSSVCTDQQRVLNQTAKDVKVKHMEIPRPPRLQDSLNPRAGKYIYHTENEFEHELYSGTAKQVHQQDRRNHEHIIMDSNSEYQKNLQELFPHDPKMWTHSPAAGMLGVAEGGMGRVEKGLRRWMALPTKTDYARELKFRPPDYRGQETELPKEQVQLKPMSTKLSSLRYAVEQWRNAWNIKISWQSVTVEGLKKDLTDLHDNVRLAAIATCASGAVNRPQEELDPAESAQHVHGWEVEPVPPELQPLLLSALSDPVKRVQIAAAVCQYSMGSPSSCAQGILRTAVQQDSSGLGADSWVAAQCLAIEGEATQAVIERLISQYFLSKTSADQDQAATLLIKISSKNTLVRSRLAEELNSANWRTRVFACHTISRLKCSVNKDLTNKLIYLMWNDWSASVRQAAAQTLGRLHKGSYIHDDLMVKLNEGPTYWQVEALVLIGHLKIMTPKLLPAFLRCLNNDFTAVRKQACLSAASLRMKDEMIMDHLIHLMQNDPSCDVKVAAISALGEIGCLTPVLEELLLWALHYEEEPSVRIAACDALKTLGVNGPELQNLLQERFILEPNPQVHRHIEGLIKSYGYSLDGDKRVVQRIADQVQKLCSKNIITGKVLLLEELEQQHLHQRKLLAQKSQPETLVTTNLKGVEA